MYRKYKEQRFQQQFEKSFDFLAFNKERTLSQRSGRYAILLKFLFCTLNGHTCQIKQLFVSTQSGNITEIWPSHHSIKSAEVRFLMHQRDLRGMRSLFYKKQPNEK